MSKQLSNPMRTIMLMVLLSVLFPAISLGQTYKKVTSAPTDWSGEYLIVYENTTTEAYVWTGVDAKSCYKSGTISNGLVTKPDGAASVTITKMSGGYSIMVNDGDNTGKYIQNNGTSNGIKYSDSPVATTISYSNSSVTISCNGKTFLFYTNTENRFRFYGSSQKPILLYKKVVTYTVTYDANGGSGTLNDSKSPYFSGSTVTVLTNQFTFSGHAFDSWNTTKDGSGTSYKSGDTFTLNDNTTLYAQWVEAKPYTVSLSDDTDNKLTEETVGAGVTLPSRSDSYGYSFAGWVTKEVTEKTGEAPDNIIPIGEYHPTSDITLYPLYKKTEGKGTTIEWHVTSLSNVDEGIYALTTPNGAAFNGTISSGHGSATTGTFSFIDGVATTAPEGLCELTLTKSGNGFTMYNSEKGYLYATKAGSGGLAWQNSESSYWSNSSSDWVYNANTAYLRTYNNSSFRTYGSSTNNALSLVKKVEVSNAQTYYWSIPVDETTLPVITADDLSIAYNATSGTITYVIDNAYDEGTLTAAITSGNDDNWISLDEVATDIPFTCSANTTYEERSVKVTLTYTYSEDKTVIRSVTVTQQGAPEPYEPFYEGFEDCAGVGGNDGNFSKTDNTSMPSDLSSRWALKNCAPADRSIKVGTSNGGSATTPELKLNSEETFVLTFKACKWASDGETLTLSSDDALFNNQKSTTVTMPAGSWSAFYVVLTGGSSSSKIMFTPQKRMFLDEVRVMTKSDYEALSLTATVQSYGWATYIPDYNVSFADGDAYIVTAASENDGLTLSAVTAVPAKTPVLLKGAGDKSISVSNAATIASPEGNLLTISNGTALAEGNPYVLAKNGEGACFKKWTGEMSDLKDRTILVLDEATANARNIFELDEAATAIEAICVSEDSKVYFNLNGQRVNHPAKGLYIVNGKKTFVR